MNEIFDNKIARIETEMTSIYSKEDVIKIITELQSNANYHLTKNTEPPAIQAAVPSNKFAEFTSKVREKLYYYLDSNEIIDLNSAEFDIAYDNKIELTRVDVDLDSWTEEFDMYMLDIFTEVFGDDSIIEQ
jgi:hypothetical protein